MKDEWLASQWNERFVSTHTGRLPTSQNKTSDINIAC